MHQVPQRDDRRACRPRKEVFPDLAAIAQLRIQPAGKPTDGGPWGHCATEGALAVHVSSLILAALQRAAAEPAGVALHGVRSAPGLFTGTAAGKQAAQRCKD